MDGASPIEAFLTGQLTEHALLTEVDRVLRDGTDADRTILLQDWRTKSGRITALPEEQARADANPASRDAELPTISVPVRPAVPVPAPARPKLPSNAAQQSPRPQPPSRPPAAAFEGAYAGSVTISGFSDPRCRASYTASATIHDNVLTFNDGRSTPITVKIASDGSFSGWGTVPGSLPPVAESLKGRVSGDALDGELENPSCRYRVSFRRIGRRG